MKVEHCPLDGVLLIKSPRISDSRGFFSETFKMTAMADAGVRESWKQDNHSYSKEKGVLRGLHFQRPPMAQGKLVRVLQGAILDVMVDIRRSSQTFGQVFSIELSRENWMQVYVPPGFAHGYVTLTDNTEVFYKVTNEYSPESEGGLAWDDPQLAVQWPFREVSLSERDKKWPTLEKLESPFP